MGAKDNSQNSKDAIVKLASMANGNQNNKEQITNISNSQSLNQPLINPQTTMFPHH